MRIAKLTDRELRARLRLVERADRAAKRWNGKPSVAARMIARELKRRERSAGKGTSAVERRDPLRNTHDRQ